MADEKRRDSNDVELGERNGRTFNEALREPVRYSPAPPSSLANHPLLPIGSYCLSSIMMTIMNKYVVSGTNWNLNFLLLAVQVRIWEGRASSGVY